MTRHDLHFFDALLRRDLASFIAKSFATIAPGVPFQPNWHIEAIAHALMECRAGRIKRLLITMPPRSLKSLSCSIAFPAWALGHDPTRRIICASYGQDLALAFSRQCRALMKSPWYRRIFPATILTKDTEAEFGTSRGGLRFATSVGGTLTGRGGSLIIIDDPLKPEDALSRAERTRVIEWYRSTLYSRLDNKRDDVIILVMQRLHLDDLAGYVMEEGGWTHLNLPAIAEGDEAIALAGGRRHRRRAGDPMIPEREPLEVLNDLRMKLGEFHFSAQYLQRPIPEDGALVKWAWFRTYDGLPAREPHDRIIQSWDTAAKAGELNDYSVCVTALTRGPDCFILDILREKLDFPSLKRRVIEAARVWRADSVLIEDSLASAALIQDLRTAAKAGDPRPIAIRPEGDKVMRLAAHSAKIEAGQVLLPKSAPWLEAFQAEALAFPHGRHDDQIDALSQLLAWVYRRKHKLVW